MKIAPLYSALLGIISFYPSRAIPEIRIDRRKPVHGLSIRVICTSDVAITGGVTFRINSVNKGACLIDGTCGSATSRYTVTQNRQQRTTTLTIDPVDSSADSGTWNCVQDGGQPSAGLQMSQFATVLVWSMMTYSPSLSSLPTSVTPQGTITVTLTTPCAAPAAIITWTYQQGISGSPSSSTSSSPGSCPSGQVKTTNTLSLPGNTVSLYNRHISLTVSVEHDSFDPPTYIRSVTTNSVQFPGENFTERNNTICVTIFIPHSHTAQITAGYQFTKKIPVTSVTMINITSDNEKVGQRDDGSLTLTCVTSASFPTSTVTWSGLPSGTKPTTSEETTSGVLVKTTSSATFTVRKNDDGNVVRCQASNIAGQTSPQSHRAVVEIWYGPDINQIQVTKPQGILVVENRDLTLTCTTLTSVYPGVTFTWDYSDGSAIAEGTAGPITGSAGSTWSETLTFQPIRTKTTVRCTVTNTRTAVSVTGTISLNAKYPPSSSPIITKFPSSMLDGQSQIITCSLTGGNPLANLNWTCAGTGSPVDSTSGQTVTSTLTFKVTKGQHDQQCRCQGSWQYGEYNQSDVRTFTIISDLPAPSDLLAWSDNPHTIKLSWKITSLDGLNQQFSIEYKEDKDRWKEANDLYNETGENFVQGSVTYLKPETLYFLRVKAVTTFGSSNYTEDARGLTKRSEDENSPAQGTANTLTIIGITTIIIGIVATVVASALTYISLKQIRISKSDKQEHYTSFQARDGNTYDEIRGREYQNTEFNSGE